jgi:hypothetical protein
LTGVAVQFEEKSRVIGINVLVLSQESKHAYEEVGRKMKIFMNDVSLKTIEELTDEEFESFKDARVKLLSAEDLDLNTEVKRNMYEITDILIFCLVMNSSYAHFFQTSNHSCD